MREVVVEAVKVYILPQAISIQVMSRNSALVPPVYVTLITGKYSSSNHFLK